MPGLLRGIARTAVVAGTASGVAGRVHHRQEQKWARQEAEQYQQQAVPEAPAAAPSGGGSTIEQLKQLGQLKAEGILTEQEFAAQKAKLLG